MCSSVGKNGFVVRQALVADGADVARLLGQLGYPTTCAEAEERLSRLGDGAEVSLLFRGGAALGLLATQAAAYFPDGSIVLRITALCVLEGERGCGAGKLLVEHARETARKAGASTVEVTTSVERDGAQAFYERVGFRRKSLRYVTSSVLPA